MMSFKKPRPVNKPLLTQNDLTVYIKQNYVIWFVIFCFVLRKHDRTFNSFVDNQFITFSSLIFFDNETTEISFKTGCKRFPLGG